MELRNEKNNEIMIFETKDKSVMLPVAVDNETVLGNHDSKGSYKNCFDEIYTGP